MAESVLNGLPHRFLITTSQKMLPLVKCKKIKYMKGTFCVLYSLYCHTDSEYMAGTC